jgi:hypothetical protein
MTDEKVLRRYDVPAVGRVNLIHDPNCELHGPYYARVENYGMAARHSQTEEEARLRAGEEIYSWLKERQSKLEKELAPIQSALFKMSVNSVKLTLLDDFQVIE